MRWLYLFVLGFASLAAGQAKLPTTAKDVAGIYVVRLGFEVDTFEFKEDGAFTQTAQHDHPGKTTWNGKWSYENGVVHVEVVFKRNGKENLSKFDCIPLAWGDRSILVSPEELKAGVVARLFREEADRVNKLGKRDVSENTLTKAPVKVKKKTDNLPFRYGKVVAPEAYRPLFEGIEIVIGQTKA